MAMSTPIAARGPRWDLAVVPLLALALFINYVGRGNLATAAPLIKGEMRLSATGWSFLVAAFFWSYGPAARSPAGSSKKSTLTAPWRSALSSGVCGWTGV
jgi:hypothetical protein